MVLVIVSLIIVCGVIVLVGSRDQWGTRRCPACRSYVPRLAQKCRYCHAPLVPLSVLRLLVVGVFLALAGPLQAFTLTDCHQVRFFQEGCGDADSAPSPAVAPPPPPLLFPKDTVAPFAPPLLVHLANNRTLENARAYLRWREARQQAHDEVQRLIEHATQEHRQTTHAPR